MREWLMRQSWNDCELKGSVSSNLTPTANSSSISQVGSSFGPNLSVPFSQVHSSIHGIITDHCTNISPNELFDLLYLVRRDRSHCVFTSLIPLHFDCRLKLLKSISMYILVDFSVFATTIKESQLPLHKDIGAEQGNVLRRSMWGSDVDPLNLFHQELNQTEEASRTSGSLRDLMLQLADNVHLEAALLPIC